MDKLVWSRDRLNKNKLIISRNLEPIGMLERGRLFDSEATAMINGRRFFLKRDFLLFKFEIYDANNQTLLGTTVLGPLSSKSELLLNGKRFTMEINNFQQSSWAWHFDGQRIINFRGPHWFSKASGEMELFVPVNEEIELLILLGMFIRNQFLLVTAIFLMLIVYIIFL